MGSITDQEITEYIKKNIKTFHDRRLLSLQNLKLDKILKRKNPYLFKAKNLVTPETLVKTLLDAHLSSQEEGIFGEFLEGLAIFINERVYRGHKSGSEGIDLEFSKDGTHYLVSIKSGPNWGNSQQIKKMKENFKRAILRLHTSGSKVNVIAVNGCCYGRNTKEYKEDYLKKCGQSFWMFVSGDDNLYTRIIYPLGHDAKKRNEEFQEEYTKVIGRFTKTFMNNFCSADGGSILWDEIVKLNSAMSYSKKSTKRTE